LTQTRNGLS